MVRMQVAERAIAYRKYEIVGRPSSTPGSWPSTTTSPRREPWEGYGLKEIRPALRVGGARSDLHPARRPPGISTPTGHALSATPWTTRGIRALSAILSQSYFVQAQIFPLSYQNVALRGNATRSTPC